MNKRILLIVLLVVLGISIIIAGVLGFLYFKSKGTSVKEKEKLYYEVGDMSTNLKGINRKVKLFITIEYTDKKLLEKFETSKQIKDVILKILRNKTADDLDGIEGHNNLQKEITNMLVKTFANEEITNVYFNEFIVQ